MKKPIFDDVGSYPLPEGTTKEWLKEAFSSAATNSQLYEIIREAMWQKINAGVEVPNYPQFQNMISQFSEPILDDSRTEAPLLVKEEEARLVELDALEGLAAEYREERGGGRGSGEGRRGSGEGGGEGEKLKLRICVTGPVELYYSLFPPPVYTDVLSNIAKSVGRFVKHAVEGARKGAKKRNYEVSCVSIDEPSIGLDPRIEVKEDEESVVTALELATEYASRTAGVDTQIHLHSPIFYETVCQVAGIKVIGLESAANPSLLALIDKKELEQHDKFLRIGVARTDIFRMAAEYDERHNTNSFGKSGKERRILEAVVNEYNSPALVKKRLEKASTIFGERVLYAGPDCGLGAFPSQELASLVLKNTSLGLRGLRERDFR